MSSTNSPSSADSRDASVEASWIADTADMVIEHARKHGVTRLVCASGISPSGPIHLGNLREAMTAHLVTEELLARGYDAVHLNSWDDYDRFRKVPAGIPTEWTAHVGKPLAQVPDPAGETDSYADHWMGPFTDALARMGVAMREVRQSELYPAGTYNASLRNALDRRSQIFDILEGFQTEGRHELSVDERRAAYYPYKPYCENCGKDATTVTGWDGHSLSYGCSACGHTGTQSLDDGHQISGKLVWKVDWPMRWAWERVGFEAAGEDHKAPSSSFASGIVLAPEIFGHAGPSSVTYSFVRNVGGGQKMSSSAGGAATPASTLEILEPPILRWLYARKLPSSGFTIDLSPAGVVRLYDEWDRYSAKVAAGQSNPVETHLYELCVRTHVGEVERAVRPVSFRQLSALVDITAANREQIARLVRAQLVNDGAADLPTSDTELLAQLQPRLDNAIRFTESLPDAERTVVRSEFNSEAWKSLDEATQAGVARLVETMTDAWDLAGLTAAVYTVPKTMAGLPADAAPTPELKKAQRQFFQALYRLLVSRDTGPRLPTLLLSLGADRARSLLTPPA